MHDPGPSPSSSSRDAPRAQVAPRNNGNSLRRASQRPPEEDPDHLFEGFDRTEVDLSWDAPRPEDINPRTGERWLYPRKRGNGPSNLEDFREEIEERTRNGQGGKAIAEALIEKGVDTHGKAVSAQRLRWGIRTKAPRRTTERGIANIKKAHLERKAREANTVHVRNLPQKERVRKMRQAEILRMSSEGMSLPTIEENLKARGVTFRRGVFKRLCTKLGLAPDPQGSARSLRHHYYNQARRQQRQEFENVAAELGIQDVEAWTKSKMDEECFIIARRERAHGLMPGDLRPTHPYPAKRKSRAQGGSRAGQDNAEPPDDQQAASAETHTPPGSGGAHGPIELSDDDTDMGSGGDDDCEGSDDEQAPAENFQPRLSPVGTQTDQPQRDPSRPNSHDAGGGPSPPPPAAATDHASHNPTGTRAAPSNHPGHTTAIVPSLPNGVPHAHYGAWADMRERPPVPTFAGQSHPIPSQQESQQQRQSPQDLTAVSDVSPPVPIQSSSQGQAQPRQSGAPRTGHRPIAPRLIAPRPRPAYTGSVFRPPAVPCIPGVTVPPGEAEMMATYGLYPVPTSKATTQKFQTPRGLVSTKGYEYLPLSWIRRLQLESPATANMPQQQQQPQQFPQSQHQSRTELTQNNTAPNRPPSPHQIEALMLPTLSPPGPRNVPKQPRAVLRKDASTQTPNCDNARPPSPPKSRIPAPPLIIPPEEAERHKASYETVLNHQKAGFECMQYLMARAEVRPLPDSLTGLPPSLKDVEIAKVRLRESAEALLAALE